MIHDSKDQSELIPGQVARSRLPLDYPFYFSTHIRRRRLRLKTATSRKLFWNCPFWRSMLTLLSAVAHNLASRVPESDIFILLIPIVPIVSGAQRPVTVITIRKLRIPISPCVFDLLSSTFISRLMADDYQTQQRITHLAADCAIIVSNCISSERRQKV